MENILTLIKTKNNIRTFVLDGIFLLAMYLVPSFAHLTSIPLYLAEPIRIIMVLAMLHTRRENAYILALTLPIFSMLTTGHPFFGKMLIITLEILLNVWLFFFILKLIENPFLAMFTSIFISKAVYYLFEYLFIKDLVYIMGMEHPLWTQLALAVTLSGYAWLILRKIKTGKTV
jgi:hypothetical protein